MPIGLLRPGRRLLPVMALAAACAACAPTIEHPAAPPASVASVAEPDPVHLRLHPPPEPVAVRRGNASYYANSFIGRRTASGERFRQDQLTAASNLLPLGAVVTVINRENGLAVEVRVNDRMGLRNQRTIVDLSRSAASKIDLVRAGVAEVEVEAVPSRQPTPELAEAVRALAFVRD